MARMPEAFAPGPRTVLHVLGSSSAAGTAQVRIVSALAREINPERYWLRAWFIEDAGPLAAELAGLGIETRQLSYRGATDLRGLFRAACGLRAGHPAIVHLHVGGGSLAWLAHWVTGTPVVVHLHGSHGEDGRPLALQSFVRRADAVIAVSADVAEHVRVPASVVYPGVALPEMPTTRERCPTSTATVGSVGRLVPVKGYSHLLVAMRLLRDRGIEVRLEIAGAGSAERELKELARRLLIDGQVSFLGWHDDPAQLHQRWDVLAMPSLHEGFPLAALEAMASGLPVVAARVGGLPELVDDGHTGYLVPAGDQRALADRLALLLGDRAVRARMGAAARERARQFSTAAMTGRIVAIYDKLTAAR